MLLALVISSLSAVYVASESKPPFAIDDVANKFFAPAGMAVGSRFILKIDATNVCNVTLTGLIMGIYLKERPGWLNVTDVSLEWSPDGVVWHPGLVKTAEYKDYDVELIPALVCAEEAFDLPVNASLTRYVKVKAERDIGPLTGEVIVFNDLDVDCHYDPDEPIVSVKDHPIRVDIKLLMIRDVAVLAISGPVVPIPIHPKAVVHVTVENQGVHFAENFTVTLEWLDVDVWRFIGKADVVALKPCFNTTVSIEWDTSKLTPCVTYKLRANASAVPEEIELKDNVLIVDMPLAAYDVAVVKIVPDVIAVWPDPGEIATWLWNPIPVVVKNEGAHRTETITVELHWFHPVAEEWVQWGVWPDLITVTLEPLEVKTVTFRWRTGWLYDRWWRGLPLPWAAPCVNYTFMLRTVPFPPAAAVPGEMDLADNVLFKPIKLELYDVGVVELSPESITVPVKVPMPKVAFEATVKNFGAHRAETFWVEFWAAEMLVDKKHVIGLPPGGVVELTFEWTPPEVPCVYPIKVLVTPVPDEYYLINNVRDGHVRVLAYIPPPAIVMAEPLYKVVYTEGPAFDVHVFVEDLDAYWDLSGFDVALYYDTALLDIVKVELGEFAKRFRLTLKVLEEVDEAKGYVRLAYTWDLVEPRPTPYGAGSLFTVTFTMVKPGDTPITLEVIGLAAFPNATKWCYDWSEPISTVVKHGLVKVVPRHVADLNADGIIDIYDLVLVCRAYGARPWDVHWDPRADIAEPWGLINIYDVVTVAARYKYKYP